MMYKVSHINRNALAAIFLSTSLVACKKVTPQPEVIPATAAISASEQMVIPAAITIPENLPTGNVRVATYFAVGVQKYKAEAIPNTSDFKWVLAGPDASLYNANNVQVGTHGVGPHWTLSAGDNILGQHFTPQKTSPSPDANSVDWLLLKPKDGTAPTGIFADVDYIQRIATSGGRAPATAPTSITDEVSVDYTAVYRFTKKK
jgi:hypothetical protein